MLTLGFQKCHFCVLKVPLLAPKSGTFARQKLNFCNAISKRMNMQSENMAFFDSIKSRSYAPYRCMGMTALTLPVGKSINVRGAVRAVRWWSHHSASARFR